MVFPIEALLWLLLGFALKSCGAPIYVRSVLARVVLWVTLPVTIFWALGGVPLGWNVFRLAFAGFLVQSSLLLLAFLASIKLVMTPGVKGVFLSAPTVANLGFFLYPIVQSLMGRRGLALLICFDIGNTLFAYTVTFAVAQAFGNQSGKRRLYNLKRMSLSPPLWGMCAGLLASHFGFFPNDGSFVTFVEILRVVNFSVAMIVLGMHVETFTQHIRLAGLIVIVRMGGGAVAGAVIAGLLRLTEMERLISVLAAGMPVGIIVLLYAVTEGLDTELAAAAVSLSIGVGWIILWLISAVT